ncbi:MAG: hypothetical protein JO092_08880 [Candidatus Eremiobacteraeota bacterium]|nr:hypothetical protein [Candidatus Eremiobacteraeota bacterium]
MIARAAATRLLIAVALVGCGGSPNTPNGPTVGSPGGPIPPPTQLVSAHLIVKLTKPLHNGEHPDYLSPNTESVAVGLASVNGSGVNGVNATIVNTSRNVPGCTRNGTDLVCSSTVEAVAGEDVFNVTTYQWPNATGSILSAGTISASIGSGGGPVQLSNGLSLSVGGVIARLALALGRPSVARGTPSRVAVMLRSFDATGAQIVGPSPFVSPIALTIEGDGVGAFRLQSGTQAGASLSITRPPQHVTLAYDGNRQAGNVTLQASVSEPNPASASAPFAVRGSPPPLPVGVIYALNAGSRAGAGATVTVYDGHGNGNLAPKRTLQLDARLYARSITVDAKGNLYVGYLDNELGFSTVNGTPDAGNEVAIFAPNASGRATPAAILKADPVTDSALFPIAMALDASGDLVTYGATTIDGNSGDAVLVYAAGSSGAVAPAHAWSFAAPQIRYAGPTGLALDSAGNFYVNGALKTSLGPSYGIFVNGAQNDGNPSATPSRTVPWTATTKLVPGQVSDVTLDSSGEIFAGNYVLSGSGSSTACQAQANVFAAGANGGTTDIAPLRVIGFGGVRTTNPLCYSPTNPLMGFYPFVVLYGATAFVADEFGNAVDAFPSGSKGMVAPSKHIAGPATNLDAPIGLYVTPPSSKQRVQ